MEKKQTLGILGALVLFAGIFAPTIALGLPLGHRLIRFPVRVSISYFQYSSTVSVGEWMVLVGLAGFALLLALTKMYLGLWLTSVLSLGTLGFTVLDLQYKMDLILTFLPQSAAGLAAQFVDLASLLLIQFEWGAILLLGGPVLMLAAAAMPEDRQARYQRILRRLAQAVVVCGNCQTANSAAYTFCGHCGAKILPTQAQYARQSAASLLHDPAGTLPPHG
jgi:hypothetical protein